MYWFIPSKKHDSYELKFEMVKQSAALFGNVHIKNKRGGVCYHPMNDRPTLLYVLIYHKHREANDPDPDPSRNFNTRDGNYQRDTVRLIPYLQIKLPLFKHRMKYSEALRLVQYEVKSTKTEIAIKRISAHNCTHCSLSLKFEANLRQHTQRGICWWKHCIKPSHDTPKWTMHSLQKNDEEKQSERTLQQRAQNEISNWAHQAKSHRLPLRHLRQILL